VRSTLHKGFIIFSFLLGFVFVGKGQEILYQHNFEEAPTNTSSYSETPNILHDQLFNSLFETDQNNFTSSAGKSGNALTLNSANITSGNTITFTLQIENGYKCNINRLEFWRRRSNTGHPNIEVKINGVQVLQTTTSNSNSGSIADISGLNFIDLRESITVTIILTGATGTTGTFRLDDFTLYGTVTEDGIVTVQDGDWNNGSTWNTGTVPGSNENVIINHAVFTNASITRDNGTTTTINKDHSLAVGAPYTNNGSTNIYGTFQLNSWGYANGNDFIYGSESYLVFNGVENYGINSGQKFWPALNGPQNVILNTNCNATLNDGARTVNGQLILDAGFYNVAGITVNGQLIIKTNGSINNNSPNYGPASSLIYQANKTYGIWKEWENTTPHNVRLSDNTTLNYTNVQKARTITGDLTIDAGSSLYMDYGNNLQSYPLTVLGNVDVYGNLTLGDIYGDDLITGGDIAFHSGYNFNPNNRAIIFIKDGSQNITTPANAALTIPYVVIGKDDGSTSTKVIINQDVTISAPDGNAGIKFKSSGSSIDINGNELIIGTPGTGNFIEGDGGFIGSNTSKLKLLGTGSVGTVRFLSHSILLSLTINRSATQTAAILGSNLIVTGTSDFSNGIVDIAGYNFTFDKNAGYTGGTNSNSFIQADGSGKVFKQFNGAGSFIYPIGDQTSGIDYSPASISFATLNTPVKVGINVRDEQHPNVSASSYITRYWNVLSEGGSDYTADTKFYYNTNDVAGSENTLKTGGYADGYWYLGDNANMTEHSLSVTNEDDLNKSYTGASEFSPIGSKPDGHFRSAASGDWNNESTWQVSADNINWHTASSAPTSTAKSITIKTGHTVTLKQNESAKNLTIESGATLTNEEASGGHILTIADNVSSSPDFDIYGTYVLFGTQPSLGSNVKVNVYSGGIVRADNNFSPGESDDFARDPNVYFKTGSVFNWNTISAFKTNDDVIYFENATNETPIFKITKNVTVGAGSPTTFNCLMSIDADVKFSGSGKKYFRDGICGSGKLIQSSGGSFEISGENAILGGTSLSIELSSVMHLLKSSTVPTDSSLKISGANLDNNVTGNIFTVNGILDMTTQNCNNAKGTINLNGTYRTAHSGGFSGSGSSIVSGTINVNVGSLVELYATGNQNLNLRNFSNIKFSGSGNKTINGTFNNPIDKIIIAENATVLWGSKKKSESVTGTTDLEMSGGKLVIETADISPAMDGTYNLTGGVIEFANNSSGTPQTIRTQTYKNIEITGTNVGNSNGNITLAPNGTFTVKNGGIFTINRYSITCPDGNGTVTVENGGVFKTGNIKGFHGYLSDVTNQSSIHQNITNIILEKGSTVEYTRAGEQPITNSNNLVYQNLVLSGSGNKIAPSNDLVIQGNFSQAGSAVFDPNGSKVIFNGTEAQNISTTSAPLNFFNLTNQNITALNIDSKITIAKTFEPGNKSRTILNGDIILKSDALNTANISIIPEGTDAASITYNTGRFVVERFIPNHSKAWQLLSVPTKGSTINQSWQQSVNVTDPRSDWQARGFDYQSASPSMKYYDATSKNYIGVQSTENLIDNIHGYFLFVRGNKTVSYGMAPTEVTLYTKGKLYAPTPAEEAPAPINILANSYALLGNPYASAIDFDPSGIIELENSYVIWDPKLTTGPYSDYGVGGYRTITGNNVVPEGGDYIDGSIPNIQSGQAFFVKNTTSLPFSFTFNEQMKTSESISIFRNKKEIPKEAGKLRINLFTKSGNDNVLLDGILALYGKDYAEVIDRLDAKKMWNAGENISIAKMAADLVIERTRIPEQADTLFLNISGLSKRAYSFEIKTDILKKLNLSATLHDRYTGNTLLDQDVNRIEFLVNNDHASSSKNRFYITYKKIIEPVVITEEHAELKNDKIYVSWKAIGEKDVVKYHVETSADGMHFDLSHLVRSNRNDFSVYEWKDPSFKTGTNYYRIRALLTDGSSIYSTLFSVEVKHPETFLGVYPNPVENKTAHLLLASQAAGSYTLSVTDAAGRKILHSVISHTGFQKKYEIKMPPTASGWCQMKITKPDGTIFTQHILIK